MQKEQLIELLQESLINAKDFDLALIEFFDNFVSVLEVIEAQRAVFLSMDLKVPYSRKNAKMRHAVILGLLNYTPEDKTAPIMVKLATVAVANIAAMLSMSSDASRKEVLMGVAEILTQFQQIFHVALDRREAIAPFGQKLTKEQQDKLLDV